MSRFAASAGTSQRDLLVDNVTDRLRLEAGIVGERWQRLKEATVRVQNHKDAFRRECALLGEEKQALEADRRAFEEEVLARWPAAALDDESKLARVTVNVGGMVFETTAEVLTKDRFSVLAALCTDNPPVQADGNGAFFFDRDGALFQHIVNFLRDDVLPEDNMVLRGLYTESSFYRLGLLRRAVEARFEMTMARAEQMARAQQMGALGYGGAMGAGNMMGMDGMSMLQQQQIAARGQNAFANLTGAGFGGRGAVAAGEAAGAAAATTAKGSSSSNATATSNTSSSHANSSTTTARSAQMNASLPSQLQMLRASQPRAAASSLPDPFGFTSSASATQGLRQSQVGIPGASFANTYRDDFGY